MTNQKRNTGLIVAVIILSIVTLVMSTLTLVFVLRSTRHESTLSSNYNREYYELLEDLNNIEVSLSKAIVSSGKGSSKYFDTISELSSDAVKCMGRLPVSTTTSSQFNSFINNLGGYCESLCNKESISDEDIETLEKAYEVAKQITSTMHGFKEKMSDNFSFSKYKMLDGVATNAFTEMLGDLDNTKVEYPELIYDGPFSDGQTKEDMKHLKHKEITKEEGEEKLRDYFSDYNISSVEHLGEMKANKIECHSYNVMSEQGTMHVHLSKKGGKLLMADCYNAPSGKEVDLDSAVKIAEEFASKIGMKNMKAVWKMQTDDIATINLAPEIDGVIMYPDLIKVKVNADNKVVGFEGKNFLTNHHKRELVKPNFDTKDIKYEISKKLDFQKECLALIPLDSGQEVLTYEITATYNDLTYFIYIDVNSGEQVQIYRVVDTGQGSLVF